MNVCAGCDSDANTKDGLCQRSNASDGLPIRCAGHWAEEKLHYFRHYLDMFTTAMSNKWNNLIFFDLFAGPGLCRTRESGAEIEGSPLIALSSQRPFTQYFFVDLSATALEALEQRVARKGIAAHITYLNDDCNAAIERITPCLPHSFLGLSLMDQTSMQVRLGAIRRLSDRKKVDLIVNFPLNMSLKRVFPLESQKAAWSEMDFFFDGPEWRELYNRYAGTDRFDNEVIDLYKSKLRSYGYIKVEDSRSIPIHRTWSHKLYYLIFASKHPLGNLFWNITAKNRPNGQREFSF